MSPEYHKFVMFWLPILMSIFNVCFSHDLLSVDVEVERRDCLTPFFMSLCYSISCKAFSGATKVHGKAHSLHSVKKMGMNDTVKCLAVVYEGDASFLFTIPDLFNHYLKEKEQQYMTCVAVHSWHCLQVQYRELPSSVYQNVVNLMSDSLFRMYPCVSSVKWLFKHGVGDD